MAAADFPNSPNVGDTYTVGTQIRQWNGTAWVLLPVTGVQGLQGTQGSSLQGLQGLQGPTGPTGPAAAADPVVTGMLFGGM